MSVAFSRTWHSLSSNRARGTSFGILIIALALTGWAIWAWQGRVSLYEVTNVARVEAELGSHSVDTDLPGRIVVNHMVLGRRVEAGETLVELDASAEVLQLLEQEIAPLALKLQKVSLESEVRVAEDALIAARTTAKAAIDEAGEKLHEAEAALGFAKVEMDRLQILRTSGVISDLEWLRSKTEFEKRSAVAEGLRLGIVRLKQEHQTIERDRLAQIEKLKSQITELEGKLLIGGATVKRLQNEIDNRAIKSPISGQLAEVAAQPTGTFVSAGTRLGVIIPDGNFKVTAEFPPESSLGLIQPGQLARIKLHGFPWNQYGTLNAFVTAVAGAPRDGHVLVELKLSPDQISPIRLQHGLPGTVEIEVKKLSPFRLMMRSVERVFNTSSTK